MASDLTAQTTEFTGGGDGTSWNQASNWDDGIPTVAKRAKIPTGQVVEISSSGQVARRVEIDGTLTVLSGAVLTITNPNDPGIQIKEDGILNNSGIILIDGTSANQGIRMKDRSTLNNLAGEQLTINDPKQEGIKTDESAIINFGTITINRPGDDDEEEGVFLDDSRATLDNHGTLVINGEGDTNEGIEMNDDTRVTNHDGAILTINTAGKGIEMDDATFDNSGVVNITNTRNDIHLEDESGMLTNQLCGIINITGGIINVDRSSATLINTGIIASDTGSNNNDGTFTNDGVIHAPGGMFDIDDPMDGTGSVIDGAIPAVQSLCFVPNPIPTLSQWSLIILGLFILSIALITIKNEERVRNAKV